MSDNHEPDDLSYKTEQREAVPQHDNIAPALTQDDLSYKRVPQSRRRLHNMTT